MGIARRGSQFREMRRGRIWKLTFIVPLALAGVGLAAQVGFADITNPPAVTPSSGPVTATFRVQGSFAPSKGCSPTAPAPTLTFVFYFDTPNAQIWTTKVDCQLNIYSTLQSPPYQPPAGSIQGGHRVVMNVIDPSTSNVLGTSASGYTI